MLLPVHGQILQLLLSKYANPATDFARHPSIKIKKLFALLRDTGKGLAI